MRIQAPLWWVWLSTFTRLLIVGDAYLFHARGRVKESAVVASIVWRACRRVRQG